ncbi:hypothetical protein NQ999_12175 [Acinetobacter baumannii]|uniref:hypothetical protein n=1 Tax=Acinetobacter baumannii TaxID=470 RepID=UPI0023421266|nr:hypothetical protein [Acinetobacter baumannii]MDC4892209.1 hypothetical protein [Acinetobacter baumannii]MDC4896723.1 hypothetical protein [Acinetobacter baumannii]MDC4899446.1 hypothetical protein [Acinetobacter baumannii]MDC4907800.1 hypothetical protein [Acinetobacter baumannii]MDC4912755.1 hypothetical protein [Acinetobacter baumannii]
MTTGICKLCGEEKELQRSHVIGRTFFSRILRDSERNVAFQFELHKKLVDTTNDTWFTRLLCSTCERFFNEKYENYSVACLREKRKEVEVIKGPEGIKYKNIDAEKIAVFILSIYWRAIHSEHHAFAECINDPVLENVLKEIIKGKLKIVPALIKVRIRLFRDSTNYFNEISLKQIIIAPFKEIFTNGYKYTMTFEGYLVEIYFGKLNISNTTNNGFLDISRNEVYIPYVEILTHRQIRESLFAGAKLIKESPEVIEKG